MNCGGVPVCIGLSHLFLNRAVDAGERTAFRFVQILFGWQLMSQPGLQIINVRFHRPADIYTCKPQPGGGGERRNIDEHCALLGKVPLTG